MLMGMGDTASLDPVIDVLASADVESFVSIRLEQLYLGPASHALFPQVARRLYAPRSERFVGCGEGRGSAFTRGRTKSSELRGSDVRPFSRNGDIWDIVSFRVIGRLFVNEGVACAPVCSEPGVLKVRNLFEWTDDDDGVGSTLACTSSADGVPHRDRGGQRNQSDAYGRRKRAHLKETTEYVIRFSSVLTFALHVCDLSLNSRIELTLFCTDLNVAFARVSLPLFGANGVLRKGRFLIPFGLSSGSVDGHLRSFKRKPQKPSLHTFQDREKVLKKAVSLGGGVSSQRIKSSLMRGNEGTQRRSSRMRRTEVFGNEAPPVSCWTSGLSDGHPVLENPETTRSRRGAERLRMSKRQEDDKSPFLAQVSLESPDVDCESIVLHEDESFLEAKFTLSETEATGALDILFNTQPCQQSSEMGGSPGGHEDAGGDGDGFGEVNHLGFPRQEFGGRSLVPSCRITTTQKVFPVIEPEASGGSGQPKFQRLKYKTFTRLQKRPGGIISGLCRANHYRHHHEPERLSGQGLYSRRAGIGSSQKVLLPWVESRAEKTRRFPKSILAQQRHCPLIWRSHTNRRVRSRDLGSSCSSSRFWGAVQRFKAADFSASSVSSIVSSQSVISFSGLPHTVLPTLSPSSVGGFNGLSASSLSSFNIVGDTSSASPHSSLPRFPSRSSLSGSNSSLVSRVSGTEDNDFSCTNSVMTVNSSPLQTTTNSLPMPLSSATLASSDSSSSSTSDMSRLLSSSRLVSRSFSSPHAQQQLRKARTQQGLSRAAALSAARSATARHGAWRRREEGRWAFLREEGKNTNRVKGKPKTGVSGVFPGTLDLRTTQKQNERISTMASSSVLQRSNPTLFLPFLFRRLCRLPPQSSSTVPSGTARVGCALRPAIQTSRKRSFFLDRAWSLLRPFRTVRQAIARAVKCYKLLDLLSRGALPSCRHSETLCRERLESVCESNLALCLNAYGFITVCLPSVLPVILFSPPHTRPFSPFVAVQPPQSSSSSNTISDHHTKTQDGIALPASNSNAWLYAILAARARDIDANRRPMFDGFKPGCRRVMRQRHDRHRNRHVTRALPTQESSSSNVKPSAKKKQQSVSGGVVENRRMPSIVQVHGQASAISSGMVVASPSSSPSSVSSSRAGSSTSPVPGYLTTTVAPVFRNHWEPPAGTTGLGERCAQWFLHSWNPVPFEKRKRILAQATRSHTTTTAPGRLAFSGSPATRHRPPPTAPYGFLHGRTVEASVRSQRTEVGATITHRFPSPEGIDNKIVPHVSSFRGAERPAAIGTISTATATAIVPFTRKKLERNEQQDQCHSEGQHFERKENSSFHQATLLDCKINGELENIQEAGKNFFLSSLQQQHTEVVRYSQKEEANIPKALPRLLLRSRSAAALLHSEDGTATTTAKGLRKVKRKSDGKRTDICVGTEENELPPSQTSDGCVAFGLEEPSIVASSSDASTLQHGGAGFIPFLYPTAAGTAERLYQEHCFRMELSKFHQHRNHHSGEEWEPLRGVNGNADRSQQQTPTQKTHLYTVSGHTTSTPMLSGGAVYDHYPHNVPSGTRSRLENYALLMTPCSQLLSTQPPYSEMQVVLNIVALPATVPLSSRDKYLLWKHRYVLRARGVGLLKLATSVDWSSHHNGISPSSPSTGAAAARERERLVEGQQHSKEPSRVRQSASGSVSERMVTSAVSSSLTPPSSLPMPQNYLSSADEFLAILSTWPIPSIDGVLELLSPLSSVPAVRRFAVKALQAFTDAQLCCFLPQFIQAARFDPPTCGTAAAGHTASVLHYLTYRSTQSALIASQLHWGLSCESEDLNEGHLFIRAHQRLLDALSSPGAGPACQRAWRVIELQKKLARQLRQLAAQIRDKRDRADRKTQRLRDLLISSSAKTARKRTYPSSASLSQPSSSVASLSEMTTSTVTTPAATPSAAASAPGGSVPPSTTTSLLQKLVSGTIPSSSAQSGATGAAAASVGAGFEDLTLTQLETPIPLPIAPFALLLGIVPELSSVVRSSQYPLVLACRVLVPPRGPAPASPAAATPVTSHTAASSGGLQQQPHPCYQPPWHAITKASGAGSTLWPPVGVVAMESNESSSAELKAGQFQIPQQAQPEGEPLTAQESKSTDAPCAGDAFERKEAALGYQADADAYAAWSLSETELRARGYQEVIKKYLFKVGDDLRQDQLVTQFVNLIDNLLMSYGCHYCLTVYNVAAFSRNDGLIEFIEDSEAISSIKKVFPTIRQYFAARHPLPSSPLGFPRRILDTFIRSCSGFSVITFLLGVGDRHLDNLMVSRDGKLFHVDFGFILGEDPKPFPPPMKLCSEMVEALGGLGSQGYTEFQLRCCQCFRCLRRHSKLIIDMLLLMVGSGIRGLRNDPLLAIHRVQEKLQLHASEAEAEAFLLDIVSVSANALFPAVVDKFHEWSVYWK